MSTTPLSLAESITTAPIIASASAEHFTFGVTDYIVFVVMLLTSSSIGVYFGFFSKAKNTTSEYLMGGKRMKTIPIAISLVASQLSGIAIMSVPAETYSFGANYCFMVLSIILVIPILNYIIVPVFYENKFDNCYEYLQKRFNMRARQLVTASFVLYSVLMCPVFMFLPSLAFAQVTNINVHLINSVVCSICVFYTMLGGIKAVVWTDVVQAGIMLSAVVLVGIMGTVGTGGLGKVLQYAGEGERLDLDFSWDPRIRITVWNTFIGGILMWTGHIGLNQSCVQRIVSLPSIQHAKKSLLIAGIGFLLVMGFNSFIGIVMYAYYHNCDPIKAGAVEKPDKMMPFFVQDILGHLNGMPGIFISCVFSAALSTLSAVLNSLGGVVYFDYIKPFIKPTDARANYIMKIFVALMGVYCVLGGFIVESFKSILQMIITFTGINSGAVAGIFLLGMFVPRVSGKVAVTSFCITIATMTFIILKGQMRIRQGFVKYEPLPTTIDGCEAMDIHVFTKNITTTPMPTTPALENPSHEFSIFDISFYWYKFVGVAVIWLVAIPLSYIWKHNDKEKQDPKLYSPFVRKFLNPPAIELEEIEPLKTTTLPIPLESMNITVIDKKENGT